MSAIEHIFKSLPELPLQFDGYISKPLFYPKHSNTIILSTDTNQDNPGVFKYNIDSNNCETLQTYVDFQPEDHGQFIDYNNDTLYILSPWIGTYTIDLKTNTINNKDVNKFNIHCGDFPKCVGISSIKGDEIHIVSDLKHHFKFDCKKKDLTMIESKKNELYDAFNVKLLYVESTKQIMILGGDFNDNIYYCDINISYEWKLMNNIKMPHCVADEMYYDILLFGDIIMVFYFDPDEDIYDIWCMDLLSYKWYKSKYNVPKSIGDCSYFMKNNNNNNVHLLDFDNQQHFVANIYDLFSNELIKERRKHCEILVIGFVKDKEKNMILNIPSPLKQLILLFYPLFG